MSAARARRIDPEPAPRPRPRAVPPAHGRAAPARPQPVRRAPARPAPARPAPRTRPGRGTPGRAAIPGGPASATRRAPLAVRLALVPVRLAILVASRLTGGRPVLAAVLLLGCGIIALHAQTLQTNQAIADRELRVAALERGTSSLRQEVSRLGATDRVSRAGRALGMVMPSPQGIGYVDARGADAASAARRIAAPSSTWNPAPGAGDAPEDGGTSGTGPVTGDGTSGTSGASSSTATPSTGTSASTSATGAASGGTGTASPSTASGPSSGATGTASSSSATSAAGTGTGTGASGGAATP